ncbi:hypothetical protein [Paenibacillus chungangensis]|uniref:Uncharacterized protein n=1 Tax=Paenibacillus chungangensis TaxID=696535 RepID=A0ABW3HKF6_9BACL
MQVKYFGIIIDHKEKRIIYGEWGLIAKIENFTGLTARQYTSIHGYRSDLDHAIEEWHGWWKYDVVTAELVWSQLSPLYEARLAELKKRGIHIDRYW